MGSIADRDNESPKQYEMRRMLEEDCIKRKWKQRHGRIPVRRSFAEPAPLRLHIIDEYLARSTFNDVVRNDLLPIALAEISKRVWMRRPVESSLLLPVECLSWYPTAGGGIKCLENVLSQGSDTCGPSNLGLKYNKNLFARHETCEDNFPNGWGTCTKTAAGAGVRDTDTLIYASVSDVGCEGGTYAYASSCLLAEDDSRPVAGYIHLCESLWVADFEAAGGKDGLAEHVRRAFVDTIVHEILHALYFNDWLYEFFVDDENQPLGKGAVVETDSQERLAIKLPVTVAKAKEHYNCTSLTSVPLENGGGGGSAGAHWEKSVIGLGETMLAQVSSGTFGAANFSPLTMALAEDSGWYRANWDAAGYQMFGKNAGCSLLTSSCTSYIQSTSKAREWFCSGDQDLKCGHDHRFVGKCRDQRPYNTCRIASPLDLLNYQFVGNAIVQTSSWCTDPANNAGVRPDGQHFGQFSRCIEVSERLAYEAGRRGRYQTSDPRCFKTSCSSTGTLQIHIGGATLDCPTGNIVSLAGIGNYEAGSLTCPDNRILCPELVCSNDCNNNGVCVDGKCICYMGYSGTECEARTCTPDFCSDGGSCNLKTGLCNDGQPSIPDAPPPPGPAAKPVTPALTPPSPSPTSGPISTPTPECAPGCKDGWIGDGECDEACRYSEACQYDAGDCDSAPIYTPVPTSGVPTSADAECAPGCPEWWIGDGECDEPCRYSAACRYDAGDCNGITYTPEPTPAECAPGCPEIWVGDGICDSACAESEACRYDLGDCSNSATPEPESPTAATPGPECAPGCPEVWIGDGICDPACEPSEACMYDAGDCDYDDSTISSSNSEYSSSGVNLGDSSSVYCSPGCLWSWIGDGFCDAPCYTEACDFDGQDCEDAEGNGEYCASGCYVEWIGDGMCDDVCYNAQCFWDADDCTVAVPEPEDYYSLGDDSEPEFCAEGCPILWINDGICDDACKDEPACQFDGNDCVESPPTPLPADFCAPGCPFIWIDDGVCDPPCFMAAACNNDGEDCTSAADEFPQLTPPSPPLPSSFPPASPTPTQVPLPTDSVPLHTPPELFSPESPPLPPAPPTPLSPRVPTLATPQAAVQATVTLGGISAAQFTPERQTVFKEGVASALGVLQRQVEILSVETALSSRSLRRRLKQASQQGSQIQVDFEITDLDTVEEANLLSEAIETAIELPEDAPGSLLGAIKDKGLSEITTIGLAEPVIVVEVDASSGPLPVLLIGAGSTGGLVVAVVFALVVWFCYCKPKRSPQVVPGGCKASSPPPNGKSQTSSPVEHETASLLPTAAAQKNTTIGVSAWQDPAVHDEAQPGHLA